MTEIAWRPARVLVLVLVTWATVSYAADPTDAAVPVPEPPPSAPGPAEPSGGAWIGVIMGDALDGGAQVMALVPEGPAARAGVRVGDVFVSLGGHDVEGRRELTRVLRKLRPDEPVELAVLRESEVATVQLTPTLRPGDPVRVVVERPPRVPRLASAYRAALPGVPGLRVVAIPEELRVHYGAPADSGVLVSAVREGSVAAAAGVRVGDIVVSAAGTPVLSPADLTRRALLSRGEETLSLVLIRERQTTDVAIELSLEPLPDGAVPGLTESYVRRAIEAREAAVDERVRMLEEEVRALREQIRRLQEELRETRERR